MCVHVCVCVCVCVCVSEWVRGHSMYNMYSQWFYSIRNSTGAHPFKSVRVANKMHHWGVFVKLKHWKEGNDRQSPPCYRCRHRDDDRPRLEEGAVIISVRKLPIESVVETVTPAWSFCLPLDWLSPPSRRDRPPSGSSVLKAVFLETSETCWKGDAVTLV